MPLVLEVLSAMLRSIFAKPSCAVILCGDFNAQPSNAVYQLLSSGAIPRNHPEITMNGKMSSIAQDVHVPKNLPPLRSAYACSPNGEPSYTLEFWKCIDFIFFSVDHLEPTSVLNVLSAKNYQVKRLPREDYGSDHISIMCKFAFK